MKYFNEQFETMPLDQLRELQVDRLKALIQRTMETIPFYQQAYDKLGIESSNDISSVADISRLPITRKEDLRVHYPFGLFGVDRDQVARVHCSSGTTGKPTAVGFSRADLNLMGEVNARSLVAAGARPGMMLHNAYGYGLFTGGLGLHSGAEKLGMNVVPVSGGVTDRQIMLIQDFRPEVICCTPSYAQRLADEFETRGIDANTLDLRFAVLGAEPWTETIRTHVEEGLAVSATNIYGLSEIIGPGVSQEDFEEKGTGSYIWEDHFYPEVVDPKTCEPLPHGEYGVLLLTTLTKEVMPMIRYCTNDICSLSYEHSQKRTHIKMSSIRGRADSMLIIRGVNLFPTQIEEVIGFVTELSANYQIIIGREERLDTILVKVEAMSEDALSPNEKVNLEAQLMTKFRESIGLNIPVQVESPGTIPRSEGGKLNRVIDRR